MIVDKYVTGPIDCCTYIVGCEESGEAAIIDPGGDAPRLIEAVRERGLSPTVILCTHAHFDHLGGVAGLVSEFGIPVCVGKRDEALYLDMEEQGRMFGVPVRQAPPPDRLLSDGDVIRVGKLSVSVIETPGHTPGGLCFLVGGALFSGDTLFDRSIGRTDLPGGSFGDILKSIRERLFILPDETVVYPGHEGSTTIGAEKRFNPYFRN